jgi:dCTP deaminase
VILSNVSLQRAIDEGRIVIIPDPQPRRPQKDSECPYQTTAVDLHLGDQISWLKDNLAISMDLRKGGFVGTFERNSDSANIAPDYAYVLQPGKLVLAQTLERIELPIREDFSLAARIEGRSSYARCGLLVHFTAPTIHAGFRGKITLEIMNWGRYPINLYGGLAICQLIVERVDRTPFSNESQFEGQVRPGGATS